MVACLTHDNAQLFALLLDKKENCKADEIKRAQNILTGRHSDSGAMGTESFGFQKVEGQFSREDEED